jgi:hypothetical protein
MPSFFFAFTLNTTSHVYASLRLVLSNSLKKGQHTLSFVNKWASLSQNHIFLRGLSNDTWHSRGVGRGSRQCHQISQGEELGSPKCHVTFLALFNNNIPVETVSERKITFFWALMLFISTPKPFKTFYFWKIKNVMSQQGVVSVSPNDTSDKKVSRTIWMAPYLENQ